MMTKRRHGGFTLVELVLYVGLASIILTLVASSAVLMTRARTKDAAIQEVESQGLEALFVMTTDLKNAQTITTPALGATASSMTLTTSVSTTTPMVFTLANGILSEQDAGGAVVPLTSSRVVVSNLSFTNYGKTGTYGSVRIQFTLTSSSTASRQSTTYSQIFYGTGTPRHISQ